MWPLQLQSMVFVSVLGFFSCIFLKNQVAGYFHSFLVYVHVGFIGFLWFLDGDFADYSVGGLGKRYCCFIL